MNIKEMMKKAFWETDIPDFAPQAWEQGYQQGANYVLEQIENFMKNLDFGNSAEEKFCKLDVLADISSFIEQLKRD